MAAIVSQLAAANRRRKANKKHHIPIEKCVYVLPPFDPCFKPEVECLHLHIDKVQLQNERNRDLSEISLMLSESGSIISFPFTSAK